MAHLIEVVKKVAMPTQCVRPGVAAAAECAAHAVIHIRQAPQEGFYLCSLRVRQLCQQ